MKHKSAFTLVELLVAVAILLILAAITAPILSLAKKSAKGSNDIAQLKNLAVAATLYNDEYSTVIGSAVRLADIGKVPQSLVSGMSDPSEEGAANVWMSEILNIPGAASQVPWRISPRDFRASFVGFEDVAVPTDYMLEHLENGGGWLVDLGSMDWKAVGDSNRAFYVHLKGKYRLLTLSGSIILRPSPVVIRTTERGSEKKCVKSAWFFDTTPEPKRVEECKSST